MLNRRKDSSGSRSGARKKSSGPDKANAPGPAISANRLLSTVAVALAGGLGWVAYWSRDTVSDWAVTVQDAVLSYLSIGTIPAALWLAAFAGAALYRRHWMRQTNLWVASVAALAALLGLLSFFSADKGALAYFTIGGEVRLGGEIGYALAGRVGEPFVGVPQWAAAVRIAAVFTVGALIAFPRVARTIAVGFAGSLVYLYVIAMVGAKATLSSIARFYRYDPPPAGAVRCKIGEATPSLDPGRGDTLLARAAEAISDSTSESGPVPSFMQGPGSSVNAAPEQLPVGFEGDDSDSGDTGIDDVYDDDFDSPGGREKEETLAASSAKVNQFWDLSRDDEEDDPDSPLARDHINGLSESPDAGPQESESDERPDSDEPAPLVSQWEKPTTELLRDAPEGGISEDEILETAETIQRTLQEYGVEVEVGQVRPGPAVTMYGLIPGWVRRYSQVKEKNEDGTPKLNASGKQAVCRVETKTRVKVDSIIQREKDLALALKTPSIRIETPVMGQSLLGIEVPNPNFGLVTLRSVMKSEEFERLRTKAQLPLALGKGSGGETVVVDLAKMPHLLIAGATGSGKSVCINSVVSCLIMERSPAELRMLLIDPKRVELTPYNGVPHLLTPVVVETDEVVGLLKGLIREMMDRYRRLEEVGARNIQAYHEKVSKKMPFLVVAVDELADLMMTASFEVEQSLCRLAQLGRATGIHLVVATQRPSVDVLTGLIKANFPSRISFGVTSQIDSRTILDTAGADKLLGRGDMLYQPIDASRPERVQGVFISDPEVEDLVSFWKTVPAGPLPQVPLHIVGDGEGRDSDGGGNSGDRDELMDRALELTQNYNKLSTSLLQRRLRIGYPRAARLMDQLEDAGVVGPSDGAKSRDVIIMAG